MDFGIGRPGEGSGLASFCGGSFAGVSASCSADGGAGSADALSALHRVGGADPAHPARRDREGEVRGGDPA